MLMTFGFGDLGIGMALDDLSIIMGFFSREEEDEDDEAEVSATRV